MKLNAAFLGLLLSFSTTTFAEETTWVAGCNRRADGKIGHSDTVLVKEANGEFVGVLPMQEASLTMKFVPQLGTRNAMFEIILKTSANQFEASAFLERDPLDYKVGVRIGQDADLDFTNTYCYLEKQ